MSKTASLTVAALLLLAAGFALGHYHSAPAPRLAPVVAAHPAISPAALQARLSDTRPRLEPPPPLTEEEIQRAKELEAELRDVLLEPNRYARMTALASQLARMSAESVPAVSPLLHEQAIGLGDAERLLLLSFWAQHDPEEALHWATREARGDLSTIAEATVIEAWAQLDPKAAEQAVFEMTKVPGFAHMASRQALVRGWTLSGLAGVVEHMRAHAPSVEQQRELAAATQERLRREGPRALIRWLDSLPQDEGVSKFKLVAFQRAAPELAKADLDLTLDWCARVCDGPSGAHVRGRIAKQWATRDGAAALRWLAASPAGSDRDDAVRNTFGAWRRAHPRLLMQWIDAMGPKNAEPWFLPAVDRVAMWKSWDYPLEALGWAERVPKEDRRELTIISILRRWLEANEAAAEAWIAKSSLSEEARKKAHSRPNGWHGRGKRPYPPKPRADRAG